MHVVFRVDASLEIGTGHVMRCLALANELRAQGASCVFISRDLPGNLFHLIESQGYRLKSLAAIKREDNSYFLKLPKEPAHVAWLGSSWQDDAAESQECIKDLNPDWLVVDHYALDHNWERALKDGAKQLMVIDDLADRPHDCDLLLDQSVGRHAIDYHGLVGSNTQLLLGSKFALIRPQFSSIRNVALQRRESSALKNILVSMGGIDRANYTYTVLQVLQKCHLPPDVTISIVMGEGAPWLQNIRDFVSSYPLHTEVLTGVSEMAKLMARADIAIGAAGVTSLERCVVGLPSIAVAAAENQMHVGSQLADMGAHWFLGAPKSGFEFSLKAAVEHAINDPYAIRLMARNSAKVADGLGLARVVGKMFPAEIKLRRAALSDGPTLYGWRNHPEVRKYFFDSSPVEFEEHMMWMRTTLSARNRVLLVASIDGTEVGCIRFDRVEDDFDRIGDELEISIYLNPDLLSKGIGGALITAASNWVKENLSGTKKITAKIVKDNIGSRKAFENAGYSMDHLVYEKKLS